MPINKLRVSTVGGERTPKFKDPNTFAWQDQPGEAKRIAATVFYMGIAAVVPIALIYAFGAIYKALGVVVK